MSRISVVGLDGTPLIPEAENLVREAALVVGGKRHLGELGVESERSALLVGDLSKAMKKVEETEGAVVVLASGDPGFFGIVRLLGERFGRESLRVLPGCSSIALAFARAGLHWDDAVVVSAHGREPRRAVNVCRARPKVAVLTAPGFGPAELARDLEGWGRTLYVAEDFGGEGERFFGGDAATVAEMEWRDPNVVIAVDEERAKPRKGWISSGIESPGRWLSPRKTSSTAPA